MSSRSSPKRQSKRKPLLVTVLRNHHGPMTKRLSLAPDGAVFKSPACALYDGEAERVAVDGLQELGERIMKLKPNEALCYGVGEHDRVALVTQEERAVHSEAIARDREHFAFLKQPGFMMFDCDQKGTPLSLEEVREVFSAVLPETAGVTTMWRPSASSCIRNTETGEEVRGVVGVRGWLPVSDASKIPKLGEIVKTRLWARGYASFMISKSGQLLDRPLFDACVWQPERIDFVAGAICEAPLEQRLPPPEIIEGATDVFDTRKLPVLTAGEIAAALNNREAARQRLAPQAREVRIAWVAERARDLADRRHVELAVAEEVLNIAVEEGVLGPDFPLQSGKYGEVSVADILAEPNKFNGTRFADPLEPDYHDDPRVAYVNLKGDTPYLYSHAHGGRRYVLSTTSAAAGDIIDTMNERFAVLAIGKNAFIADQTTSKEPGRVSIEFLSRPAFNLLMCNRKRTDETSGHLGNQWLWSPRRKEYAGVEFNPGGTTPGFLNLFTGFHITPSPGCTTLWWAFVRDIICCGNEDAYRYVRRWLAHLIQKTGELPGTALVLRGMQGTGKNTFAEAIGRLVMPHFIELSSMGQVTGRFNSHTKQALVVFANEAIWGGSKQEIGVLKGMITDKLIAIEAKGIDIIQIENFRRLIVASNEVWAVAADADDRRFVFLDISPARANDREYFEALRAELNAGGYEALMHDLTTEDLSGFEPAKRPMTGFGFDIKLRSADSIVKWAFEALDSGGITSSDEWPTSIGKSEIYTLYRDFYAQTEMRKPEVASEFHKKLKGIFPSFRDQRPGPDKKSQLQPSAQVATKRPRVYALPPLEVARKDFERYMHSEGMVTWSPVAMPPALRVVQAVQAGQGGKVGKSRKAR